MNLENRFSTYLKTRYNQLSKNTIKSYKSDAYTFIRWCENKFNLALTNNPAWENTQTIMEIYKKEKLLEKKVSPLSFKRQLSSIRKLFQFLNQEGIISHNPFKTEGEPYKLSMENDKWYLKEFKNYLSISNKSNHTIKNYMFDIQRFLNWLDNQTREGNINNNINSNLLNEYKNSLLKKGLAIRSIKRNFYSIQKYLIWKSTESQSKNLDFVTPTGLLPRFAIPRINNNSKPIFKDIPSISHQFPIPNPSPDEKISSNTDAGWYKKIASHIFDKMPKWYKIYHSYSFTHYLHLSIMAFFVSIVAIVIYQSLTPNQYKSVLASFITKQNQNISKELKDYIYASKFDLATISQNFLRQGEVIIKRSPKIISPISATDRIHSHLVSPLGKKSLATSLNQINNNPQDSNGSLGIQNAINSANRLSNQ